MRNKHIFALFLAYLILYPASVRSEIIVDPFGPNGEGGTLNGQTFTFGQFGQVFEYEAFLFVPGRYLGQDDEGPSRQLSRGTIPELEYVFSYELKGKSELYINYRLTNISEQMFPEFNFLVFVNGDIGDVWFNDYGQANGTLGVGSSDPDPDSWEIDEPGFIFGDIYKNLRDGNLDNTNSVPATMPEDASMALGFQIKSLKQSETANIRILLSSNGSTLGDFHLSTSQEGFSDILTFSGQSSIIPEPSALLQTGLGILGLTGFGWWHRRRKQSQASAE